MRLLPPFRRVALLASLLAPSSALGQDEPYRIERPPPSDAPQPPPAPPPARDRRDELPRLGVTESPFGLEKGSYFAGVVGTGVSAKSDQKASGGVQIGASPLAGLAFHGLVGRDATGRFSPVITGHYRILGGPGDGFALGVLGQYKAEGFDELGGEAETGVTLGFRRGRFSMMSNAIVGVGVEEKEEGEVDGEAKLRLGYSVIDSLRVGAEGQVRRRFAGDALRPNGKSWDVFGGPQLMLSLSPVVVALTGGVTNVAVADGVGAFGMLNVAAVVP